VVADIQLRLMSVLYYEKPAAQETTQGIRA